LFQAYLDAVQSQKDIRLALRRGDDVTDSTALVRGPRVVHQSRSTHKTIDTDDAQELSRVHNGGIITETRRTKDHEEVHGDHLPEGGDSEEERELDQKEGNQRFAHTKEQELVQFRGNNGRIIGEQMRYQAENVEGGTDGHQDPEWESLSTRMQRMRRQQVGPAAVASPFVDPAAALDAAAAQSAAQARKDALTKKPLDFDQEEETRKMETSKWLEHHFGSDSRSSKSSLADEHQTVPSSANFINVTMKSRPIRATPSPRPTSPPEQKTLVFLSTPEPQSLISSPPPPPAPVLPTSVNKPNRLLNGRQNSSSSGSGTAGFFQGVSDWSERKSSTPPTKEPLGLLNSAPKSPLVLASTNVSPRVSSLVEALNRANTNIGGGGGGSSSAVKASSSPTHHKQRDASPVISPSPAAVSSSPSHGLNGSVSPGMGYTTQHQTTRPISPPQVRYIHICILLLLWICVLRLCFKYVSTRFQNSFLHLGVEISNNYFMRSSFSLRIT
jgi:hypothetical protein